MKTSIQIFLAAVLGSVLTLGLFTVVNSNKNEPVVQYVTAKDSPEYRLTRNQDRQTPVADFVPAADKALPAVVHITSSSVVKRSSGELYGVPDPFRDFFNMPAPRSNRRGKGELRQGTGSGVIVSSDGYIVTNNHVIEHADIIQVSLSDKRTFNASLIGTDPSTDLALLKIEASDLVAAEFDDSDDVRVGEWVAAIGNPFSYLKSTVTAGIVSAKGRDIDIIQTNDNTAIEEFIQTDAAINPGNSGGALVNIEGDLIGINTAIATPTGVYAGYSFAIPSNLVKRIIDDIKQNGNIQRGRLGVRGLTVSEEIIIENKLKAKKGFYVEMVDKGSGAQFAGVLPGDVIISANDRRVDNFDDLYAEIEFAKVGDKIKLGILRRNKELELTVNLRKGI